MHSVNKIQRVHKKIQQLFYNFTSDAIFDKKSIPWSGMLQQMKSSVGGQSLNYNLTPFNLVIQSFRRRRGPSLTTQTPSRPFYRDANALIIKRAMGVHIHIKAGRQLSHAQRGLASLQGAALTRTLSISCIYTRALWPAYLRESYRKWRANFITSCAAGQWAAHKSSNILPARISFSEEKKPINYK